jgi:hypothetical protein
MVLDLKTVPQFVIAPEIPGAGALSEPQIRELALRSLPIKGIDCREMIWLGRVLDHRGTKRGTRAEAQS